MKQDKTDRSLKTDSAGLPVATGTPTHSEGPEKPQQFNLMTDGSRLAMPNSYRKLKSVHLKLYSQLKNIHSEGDSSRNFLEHFESTFKDYNVKMTHVELEKESKRLLREHDELFEIVASVAQQSAAINDSSPWHEVYSCYCSWQFILTKFKELQKRTQTLLEGWYFLRVQVRERVSQSVSQPINQSVGRSVVRSVSRSFGQSVGRSVSQSVGQSVSRSVSQSVNE